MNPVSLTTIKVTPRTNVRSTQNERWLLSDRIKYEYLRQLDEKRLITHGKKGTLESRKRQLDVHQQNKQEIRDWVQANNFKLPLSSFAAWFYVPIPASWRPGKVKEMLYTVHQGTPDLDNFLKQLFDSAMPRKNRMKKEKGSDDRKIYCYAAFKVWVKEDEGCIKIIEYDEVEFFKTFEHGLPYFTNTPDQ